jgi:predicted aspartyl protease
MATSMPFNKNKIASLAPTLIGAGLILLAPACRKQIVVGPGVSFSLADPSTLPARLSIDLTYHGGHLYLPAEVNGTAAGMFMLDTGSSLTVIGRGAAQRLGLPEARRGSTRGVGGYEQFNFRRVRSVSVSGLGLPPKDLACLSLARFRKPFGIAINGIVGFPDLGAAPFTIDHQEAKLHLMRRDLFEPPDGAHRNALTFQSGLPTVWARLSGNRRIRLLIDTGDDGHLTLPPWCAKAWPDIIGLPITGTGKTMGIGGIVDGIRTWVTSLEIFGIELQYVPVNFDAAPEGQSPTRQATGRIGNSLLQHFGLTFDPAKRVVWTQWRPEGAPPALH